ncbi:hypothetical protein K227x_56360 [Rubripirellula lacrimiformis]|uniref:3-keto-alpha-glucoside-1,2-lyase/3-keto-2-hydroxy-glucal hydratase domain-containing protein n=1 Tax=Rubripirellula lacrimiformis TaxID=1930273 RepID=A0A517NJA2_9BACT|nr:DUF1080 domain-containing protein [Rubripirellula lacrimiformis]QDT07211.1 hypothetical protein K227x_56360 [Rubripirellula lacrimiformis]
MKPLFRRAVIVGALFSCFVAMCSSHATLRAEVPEGFTPLFNGKDLSGWKGLVGNPKTRAAMTESELSDAQKVADQSMRDHWKVVDGMLVFDGQGESLCTAKDYGDFEMFVDWKILEGGDSGIYLRGSPQVQIWDTEHEDYFRHGAENGSGALWNNKDNPRMPLVKADRPVGQWNTFYIRMVGERVTIKLNDQLVTDRAVMENLWERGLPIYRDGQLELQNHGNTLYFRNLFVREIDSEEANEILREDKDGLFDSLFDGTDLAGWRGAVEDYKVVDGNIVSVAGKSGNMYTEKEYGDFIARVEFKLPPAGNNGLLVRHSGESLENPEWLELQILDDDDPSYKNLDDRQYHGSIYGLVPAHRGFLRPVGEWNFQQVTVTGTKYKVELNGFTILEADLSEVTESKTGPVPAAAKRTSGHFGFAGHQEPVAFRNVSIRELPGEPAAIPDRETAVSPTDQRIELFNGKNFEGFYTWIRDSKYSDPKKIFTVKDGQIHISGDGYGGLITNQTYRDYHLVLEFMLGEKTWGDRIDRARDSGLLVHAWGPDGGYANTWMASVEAQIIEGGVGDILVLSGTDPVTGQVLKTSLTAEITKDRDGEKVWKKGGEPITIHGGRINWFGRDVDWADKIGFRGKQDVESPVNEWTRLEVIAEGEKLTYLVNGVVVNQAIKASPSAGKLILQTEQAEMFVRKFELWPLGKAPAADAKN